MNKRLILMTGTLLLIALMFFTAGCARGEEAASTRAKVTKEQVAKFQKEKKQKRVDIYIPIKEQFAASKHSKSLEILLNYKGQTRPACYSCMSADYYLAPPDKKPDPKTLKYSVTCAVCHVLTVNEFKLRLNPLETCTSCHNSGREIVPGEAVHHPQKEMFLGYGAIDVPKIPDSKYKAGLTCIECHMPNNAHNFIGKTPAQSLKENTGSICIMCHADQSEIEFAQEVAGIQNKIESDLKKLKAGLGKDGIKLANAQRLGQDVTVARQVYNIVFTNLSFVENDGSKGVHNFEYAKKIIEITAEKKKQLDKLLEGY